MVSYNRILIAFDGSEHSEKALHVASRMKKDHDARLTVVNVDEPLLDEHSDLFASADVNANVLPMQANITSSFSKDHKRHEFEDSFSTTLVSERAKNILNTAKSILADEENVDYMTLRGNPKKEIDRYAEANDIDLIVVGRRGLTGMEKLFMGSVSKNVSNHADCSVLIVQ